MMLGVLVSLVLDTTAVAAPDATTRPRFHALLQREWEREQRREPVAASLRGDQRYNDRWPDLSFEAVARDREAQAAALTELRAIDRSALPPMEQVTYDVLTYELEMAAESDRHEWSLVAITTLGGIHTSGSLAMRLPLASIRDYEDWLARLRSFPTYMDQTLAVLQRGIERRRLQPRVVVDRIEAQVARLLAEKPTDTDFYRPFKNLPPGIPAADCERLATDGRRAIVGQVIPALRKLDAFLAGPYRAAAPETVGLWALPGGDKLYAHLVRLQTTTRLSPDEIHEIGLREVARIEAELDRCRAEVGFAGSVAEFVQHLRTDSAFQFRNADDVLTAARATAKRIDPALVKVFRTLPRIPYGIEPLPAAQATDAPASYVPPAGDGSQPGYCRVNTIRPARTWLTLSLLLHEAVPGHHLQRALAMEQVDLPELRRYHSYSAFNEGWGLYAEFLGEEMGLYDDPYQRIGRVVAEMARAVRLVVDTGIHARRWDRKRALEYLRLHAPMSEAEITAEVDRYIAVPAQALAYKIGELKLQELRQRATETLGERMDVKEFHDVVLLSGSVPLDVLESNVEGWIARESSGYRQPRGPGAEAP